MNAPLRRAADPWLPYRKALPAPALRLFCFPNAGGGASIFRHFAAGPLPPEVEVCAVQLPGRENRLGEPPFKRAVPLADALAGALAPYLDRPFAFFGHSMGTVIGFELAHRLRAAGLPEPSLLVMAGRQAPHLPPKREPVHALPDADLIARLREYDGTPQAVLEHEELMTLMLPLLRADFELVETYEVPERPPLSCPIAVYGGLEDRDAPRPDLEAWGELTAGACRVRMFPGGHFFLHRDRRLALTALAEDLLPLLPRP
ncbi:MAG: thioesterase [Acidobacteria bacterium]|nr:MAG: thioesterase [Acidobacteriota bacterium]